MNNRSVAYSMMTTITLLRGISDKVVKRVNLKKILIIRKKYFFLLFGVYMRWWMLTKFTVVIIHNIRKSNHYAVHLKLTLLFSGQVLSNCLQLHGQQPTRILCPWDPPGNTSGLGCHFLLQRIFPTQELNLCLLHWQVDSLPLSHQKSPNLHCTVCQLYLKKRGSWSVGSGSDMGMYTNKCGVLWLHSSACTTPWEDKGGSGHLCTRGRCKDGFHRSTWKWLHGLENTFPVPWLRQ